MDYLTRHENFVDRRRLFKNIWDTAMTIEDGDAGSDILSKPKVIKTLRLDEVDRCIVPKKKKQRIKNLRMVCNRILKFCDKQESEDCYYEQYATHSNLPVTETDAAVPMPVEPSNHKKLKLVRKRRKISRAKSVLSPGTKKLQYENLHPKSSLKTSRMTTPLKKVKRETILRNSSVFKTPPVKAPLKVETTLFGDNINRSKIVKKKSPKAVK